MHGSLNRPPLIAPSSRVIKARTMFGMLVNRHCGVVAGRAGSILTNGCNGAAGPISPRLRGGTLKSRRPVAYHPTSLVPSRLSALHGRYTR